MLLRGTNTGQIGKIETIIEGTFILPKRAVLALGDRKIEIPADIIMVIGKEEPIIQIKWSYVSNNRIFNEKNISRESSSKHGTRQVRRYNWICK